MAITQEEGQNLIKAFCKDYKSALGVTYMVRNQQEDIFGEQANVEAVGKIYGAYFPSRKLAAFAAANFRDQDQFNGTLKHEILGHFGINTLQPREKLGLLNKLIDSKEQPGIKELWEKVDAAYSDKPALLKAEEIYAFACEDISPSALVDISACEASLKKCLTSDSPMSLRDLRNVTNLVASGMRDGTRKQEIFPATDDEQFKRETTMENKKPFHEVVAEKLIEQLKTNTAPWQRPWEPGEQRQFLPYNPTTGNRYKGINALHLLSQNHDDQRWMTYKQAQDVGAQVRKGEKGTLVQYWKFSEEQTKLDDNGKPVIGADGKPEKVNVQLERPRCFMATVFNASQIDGLPPAEIVQPIERWQAHERAEKILGASEAKIFHDQMDRAFYRSSDDTIHLPEKSQFPSPDRYYATALHEVGHSTGHESRLDRKLGNTFGSEDYAREELRAEISSMILGQELGIGHDPEQHVAYVQSWIKVLKDDPLEIFRAAADAEKIHDYVLSLENKLELNNQLSEYESQALSFLEANYGVASLSEAQRTYLELKAKEGDAPTVAARTLAEDYSLNLTESGVITASVQTLLHTRDRLRNDQSLAFFDNGINANGESQFVVRTTDYRHVLESDKRIDTAWIVESTDLKTGEVISANPDLYIKDLMSLGNNTLAQSRLSGVLDQYKKPEIPESNNLDADISLVLKDKNLTFDHFQSFLGKDLESSLRDLGFNKISDITGTNPEAFYDTAFKKLSPVFGITEDHSDMGNPYLERKGLVQAFSNQAEALHLTATQKQQQENHGMGTPDESLNASPKEQLIRDTELSLGIEIPRDWNGNIQMQGNITIQDGDKVIIEPASKMGREPEFYSLYAQQSDGTYQWLNDYENQELAIKDKDSLTEVAAELEDNELERAAMLARLHEERVRRNPNSTDDEVLAAKEARKDAEFNATAGELQSGQQVANQTASEIELAPQAVRVKLQVPYKEKDEAKALGATWDRKEQAWFVPPGVNPEPFAKWAVQPPQNAANQSLAESAAIAPVENNTPKTASERVYLAVPYSEREEAKKLGAKWDTKAKSWYAEGGSENQEKLKKWLPENITNEQSPAKTVQDEFADALRSLGCIVPPGSQHPIMDGKKHRIETEGDKHGEKAGFYVGHTDGHPAGFIQNNKTGQSLKWKSKGYTLSEEEKAKLAAEAANKLAAREAEQKQTHLDTADKLQKQLASLSPLIEPTPYLENKSCSVNAGVFTDDKNKTTFIPAYDADGKVWTVQYINEEGTKRFAKDSKKEGCFHVIGGLDKLADAPALVIGEGYATADSTAKVLGFATVAAFDSGNLLEVGKALAAKYPDKPIIFIGDDDRHLNLTQGVNAGREKAEAAAKELNGKAVFPIFSPGEQNYPENLPQITPELYKKHLATVEKGSSIESGTVLDKAQLGALSKIKGYTDFNDLANKSELGPEAIKRQLKPIVEKTITEHQAKSKTQSAALKASQERGQEERKQRSMKIS